MKDNRVIIPYGTKIEQSNNQLIYTVLDVIGFGGSCVAYDAYYTDKYNVRHDCILKQLHPISLASESVWDKVNVTEDELERFLKSSALQSSIAEKTGTENSTSVIRSVFSYADSLYFQVSEKSAGVSLDKMNFTEIHDYLSVIYQVARIICEYHSQGWVHLDIKPQNIFCKYNGNGSLTVSMFDFDSMIKIDSILDPATLLSCSKEYAPPELLQGKRNKISFSSDYYELSCMLFEKLFGRLPKSTEIAGFCKYRFNDSILQDCRNTDLIDSIQKFFKQSLTVNINNRFSTDEEFVKSLENIYELSKAEKPIIVSNFTTPSTYFTGRDSEISLLREMLLKSEQVIIQGVGGIGKSSLALNYANKFRSDYKTILYLEYDGSFDVFIENEIQILNTSSGISLEEKMNLFKELCDDHTLVIIDNLDHIEYEQLEEYWFTLPCHLIITSRGSNEKYKDSTITLSGIKDAQKLFFHYYTEPCSDLETKYVDEILYSIDSHTMMTELLGKYCGNCYREYGNSNLEVLWNAFNNYDIESAGDDRVKQFKDWTPSNRSIQAHMDVLFSVFSFTEPERYILKTLSLIGLKSVTENLLNKWCNDYDSKSLSRLKIIGIVQFSEETGYKLHPLIIDRVLYNFKPDANDMAKVTERIADSLSASKSKNKEMLIRVAENYSDHIIGIHRSLAYMYQVLYCKGPKIKKELYQNKSIEIFKTTENGIIPAYFKLKTLEKKYSGLFAFSDEDITKKIALSEEFIQECDNELKNSNEYKIIQNYEMIANICALLACNDTYNVPEERLKLFYEYQVRFLEKALNKCSSEEDKERVAEKIYNCYSDMFSPIHNSVKAEKYKRIADIGVKVYKNGVRIGNSEQEQDADLIDALIEDNQKEECLELVDKWYDRYINEKIQLDPYLLFLMESIYEQTNKWDRYLELVQGEKEIEGYDKSLSLGKAFLNLKNRDKSNEFLMKSVNYYSNQVSGVLNYEMERYLLASGYMVQNNTLSKDSRKYEDDFFKKTEKYYDTCMFEKADDLAILCFLLSKEYLKKAKLAKVTDVFSFITNDSTSKKEENSLKAARFLKLYSRFRDVSRVEDNEYQDFIKLTSQLIPANKEFFWIKIFRADYLEEKTMSESALKEYVRLIELLSKHDKASSVIKKYKQYTLYQIEKCDFSYFAEKYSSEIDYVLINELKNQSREGTDSFDMIVNDKLEIVRNYGRIGSDRGITILKDLVNEINMFDGDIIEKISAINHIEKYYAGEKQTDIALDFALKRFDLSQNILELKELSFVCCDISEYYGFKCEADNQLEWLNRAVDYAEQLEISNRENVDLVLTVHKKLQDYYSAHKCIEMQINENQIMERIIISQNFRKYEKELLEVYNNLNKLYMQIHNLTQAYFYSSLADTIVQKSII